jgi:hypothetical protein
MMRFIGSSDTCKHHRKAQVRHYFEGEHGAGILGNSTDPGRYAGITLVSRESEPRSS